MKTCILAISLENLLHGAFCSFPPWSEINYNKVLFLKSKLKNGVKYCYSKYLRKCLGSRNLHLQMYPLFVFNDIKYSLSFCCLPFVCCVYLSIQCTNKSVCVFLVASYTDGQPTENAEWFCKWLEEASTDFRYGKTYLKGLRYAVFGLGNSVYVGHYNTVRCGFYILFYKKSNTA